MNIRQVANWRDGSRRLAGFKIDVPAIGYDLGLSPVLIRRKFGNRMQERGGKFILFDLSHSIYGPKFVFVARALTRHFSKCLIRKYDERWYATLPCDAQP